MGKNTLTKSYKKTASLQFACRFGHNSQCTFDLTSGFPILLFPRGLRLLSNKTSLREGHASVAVELHLILSYDFRRVQHSDRRTDRRTAKTHFGMFSMFAQINRGPQQRGPYWPENVGQHALLSCFPFTLARLSCKKNYTRFCWYCLIWNILRLSKFPGFISARERRTATRHSLADTKPGNLESRRIFQIRQYQQNRV